MDAIFARLNNNEEPMLVTPHPHFVGDLGEMHHGKTKEGR
jgi:hypothetical protein